MPDAVMQQQLKDHLKESWNYVVERMSPEAYQQLRSKYIAVYAWANEIFPAATALTPSVAEIESNIYEFQKLKYPS